jgi:hypothetical protein
MLVAVLRVTVDPTNPCEPEHREDAQSDEHGDRDGESKDLGNHVARIRSGATPVARHWSWSAEAEIDRDGAEPWARQATCRGFTDT